jgi:membrane protein implicated in regulation of membrane protease activity
MDNVTLNLWICAVAGTLFFLLRIGMSILFGVHHDFGGMHEGHADLGNETDFKLVSLYSVFAFFMIFGWSGLAAYQQFSYAAPTSVAIATVVGVATMFLVALLLSLFVKFTSSGDTFTLKDIVGMKGTVYERIPDQGVGVIQITCEGLLREVRASAADGKSIDSFTEVVVSGVVDKDSVSVRKATNS